MKISEVYMINFSKRCEVRLDQNNCYLFAAVSSGDKPILERYP